MPNHKVFCNSPWYELHIYWDGRYNFCCAASHTVYSAEEASTYCVQNMSIRDWYNSDPMKQARLAMFAQQPNSFCSSCMAQERFGSTSRRCRANQKSVIFTRSAFDASYRQSPGYQIFEHSRLQGGDYGGMPIDLHIDLGNYCNLACKMCSPEASSRIATQYKKWKILDADKFTNTDWTRNADVWQRVLTELAGISNLKNIHFMGGETLATKRFEDFVDFMTNQNRFDLNFSFATNGTKFDHQLMNKLSRFSRVGIEVSIESLDATNSYQRQGTDQDLVMRNLELYRSYCDKEHISLTLKPAISALTIGSYPQLLSYAFERKLTVKGSLVHDPEYLDARVLPRVVRGSYLERYNDLARVLNTGLIDLDSDYNESNPYEYLRTIAYQIRLCQSVLSDNTLDDKDNLQSQLVSWCRRWDDLYGYDARSIYPELRAMWDGHGY